MSKNSFAFQNKMQVWLICLTMAAGPLLIFTYQVTFDAEKLLSLYLLQYQIKMQHNILDLKQIIWKSDLLQFFTFSHTIQTYNGANWFECLKINYCYYRAHVIQSNSWSLA